MRNKLNYFKVAILSLVANSIVSCDFRSENNSKQIGKIKNQEIEKLSSLELIQDSVGWKVEVNIVNQNPFTICLSSNWQATSRLKFIDDNSALVGNGGFEGKSILNCIPMSSDSVLKAKYNSVQYAKADLRGVKSVCYIENWKRENGRDKGIIKICDNVRK